MSYRIKVSAKAEKDMMRLPIQERAKVAHKDRPARPGPAASGSHFAIATATARCSKLKGRTEELWRIRSGDYRILYAINDEVRIMDVRKVGNRRDVYR